MKNKKSLAIGLLCMALVFMGIGYSLFSTTLNITGSSQGGGTFDVKITNVQVDSNNTSSGATNTMDPIGNDYAVTETTLSATFNAPGDYITYNITVTNRGSIDAAISVETNMLDSTDSFELSCTVTEGTEVQANSYITFPCVMKFKDDVDDLSNIETANMSVSLKAVQKATYTPPAEQSNPESCFVSFNEGEINYYNTSLPGCGTNVVIPNNLNLTVSTVTDYTVDDELCEEEAAEDETTCQAIKDDLASRFLNYGYTDIDNGVLGSDYPHIVTPIYSSSGNTSYPIEKIGDVAFAFKDISSISIPNNIVEIGVGSFALNDLHSITLPGNLETIGKYAFAFNSLTGTLTIPASVESIGFGAFGADEPGDGEISSLVFESGSHLQTIGGCAFANNNISGTLTLPASVTSIGIASFAYNQISGILTIPDSVETIEKEAFYENKINTLNLGSGLTSLGSRAFKNNSNNGTLTLTTININMTEATWNSRYLHTIDWYSSDENVPVVTYLQN